MDRNIRDIISDQGWTGYILPCRDSFLSSSQTARHHILQLTGFEGSTSAVFLTPHKTYLFVDGRYTVQAAHQAPECEVITCTSPLTHIYAMVSPLDKVAVNPWLFSVKEIKSLQEKIEYQGAILVFDTDAVLTKAISPPSEPCTTPIKSMESDRTFQEKCQLVFGPLLDKPFLLCKAEDIAWLTNLRGRDCSYSPIFYSYLIVTYENARYKGTVFTHLPRSTECCDPDLSFSTCEDLSDFLNAKDVFYDPGTTPYRLHMLSHTRWHDRTLSPLAYARARKTLYEKHHIEHAHIQDGAAVTRFLHWLSCHALSGQETEFSAAQHIERERTKHSSYEGPSFSTISAFGSHSAIIHYTPLREGSRPLQEGLYLIDSGGQYRFGTTDITRTLWLGSTPSLRHKRLYTLVLQAHIHLASQVFPLGTQAIQLDSAARSFLWQHGLDYPHSTGHGVGCYLSVHESPPSLSPRLHDCVIEEGMIFSNEPGYYEEGWGGIRLENVVCVEEKNKKLCLNTVSLAPFDRTLIAVDELSSSHKRWLNAYHDRVYRTLSPLLDSAVCSWLYQETRPI
jgi:Xaa-Pro aminopeptidase